jgi:hypothetical protein
MQNDSLSGAQIRAARALLRWSVGELARNALLGLNTIKRAEANDGETSLTAANKLAIRRALESAGVEFTNGDQPGVRFSRAAAPLAVVPSPRAPRATAAKKPARGKATEATEKKR